MYKKMKKIYILTFLSIILTVLPIFIVNSNEFKQLQIKDGNDLKGLKISAVYEDIGIDDRPGSPFNWIWARTQPWCTTGNGTQENPYIIEDETFSGAGTGLAIINSIKYFIVRNCTFTNFGTKFMLDNITNGQILNNQIFDKGTALYALCVNDTIISNNNIYNSTGGMGIFLWGCFFNNLTGNTVYNNTGYGILLDSCGFNNLTGNTVYNNAWDGIALWASSFNDFIRNTIYNNTYSGFSLHSNSDYNNLTGNTAYNNLENGIYLEFSQNNDLSGNTIYNNTMSGIFLETESDYNNITENTVYNNIQHGIYLDDSYELFVWDNYIYQNGISGIYAASCRDDEFYGNVIRNNIDTGVILVSSSNMFFHDNFFLKNGKHAVDDSSNSWNSTTIGNYWDNHTGPDTTPKDGIVDFPYNISGSAGNKDYFPIAEDGAPTIDTNSPNSGNVFDVTAPAFNVRITDDYLDTMWYTLDGGLNNYTFTDNSTIEQPAWDAMPDGTITLKFYASDIPGNIGTAEINIIKDIQTPIMDITSPTSGDKFSDAPIFNVKITDENLDTMWYTLDGGLTNLTFSTNGTVDSTSWLALPNGPITLTFYANDTLGHLASAEVIIEKDTEAPIITINSPNDGEVFENDAPSFDVSVTDPNLDTIWLSFEGLSIPLSAPIIGTINQTLWSALPEGNYTITFFANDTLGNMASEEVTITKNIPSKGGIGLDYSTTSILIFLISTVAIITIITRIRSKKRILT